MVKIFASTSSDVTKQEREHAAISRKLAGESMVLLENDTTLPINNMKKVALFGNGARRTIKGGSGSGEVNSRNYINIEQGLENEGITIMTKDWIDRYEQVCIHAKDEYMKWIKNEAQRLNVPVFAITMAHPYKDPEVIAVEEQDISNAECDTVIYIISRTSGEGADRSCIEGDYYLYQMEQSNIEKLAASFDKVIVVLNVGGVMDLSALRKISNINAILLMGQLGSIGGEALSDVLTGRVTPSGKTTDTWAKDYMDYPSSANFSHNNGNIDDEYYEDGIYVGYRYFDTWKVEPQYCFGYGLSYTDFTIETQQAMIQDNQILLEVCVKNIGEKYSGKEVVQVYYSAPKGKLDKPYQELIAFKKTKLLSPGESEQLSFTIDIKNMASYSEAEASWILEAGNYIVRVGNSSKDNEAVADVHISKQLNTYKCRNLFMLDCELKELKPVIVKTKEESTALHLEYDSTAYTTNTINYQYERPVIPNNRQEKLTIHDLKSKSCTVEELVSQLTVEETANLCVGTFRIGESSTIGNASYIVPGAAGDTSNMIEESRGIRNLIMADGPAGLRLQPHFKTDKAGNLLKGGTVMSDNYEPFDTELDEVDNYYQYCTAIPIGWSLAQSWNEELAEKAGDIVGEEMEQFGIDLWLAPALNIHRNPLCGRNFEYYSEDPLISGKIAAAITKGVQKHEGRGTTIKHFAANNQEDNRYYINAHISERAMREIYLKGFEIAVKESQPFSIMTSYNLINGIHAANCYDLIQSVARDEWGFNGLVMTDWFTSQAQPAEVGGHKAIYPISASTGCIYAGNDLQMPGCQKNVDDIVEAVKTGKTIDGYKITMGDLQYNAANVIRVALKAK